MKTSNLTLVSEQLLVNFTKYYCHLSSFLVYEPTNEKLGDISVNLRWTFSSYWFVQKNVLSSYDANTKTVEVTAGIAAKKETNGLSCQPA